MKTCGDIGDGKQCEFFSPKEWDIGDRECVSRDPSCPRKYEGTTSSTRACAPMLALAESRARVAELEAERDCDKCICVLASNAVASFLQRAVRDLGVCPRCGKDTHRMIPSFRDQDPFPFCSEGCRFWGYGNPRRG